MIRTIDKLEPLVFSLDGLVVEVLVVGVLASLEGALEGAVEGAPPKCSSNIFLSWSSFKVASSSSASAYSKRSNESSAPIKRSSRLSSGRRGSAVWKGTAPEFCRVRMGHRVSEVILRNGNLIIKSNNWKS